MSCKDCDDYHVGQNSQCLKIRNISPTSAKLKKKTKKYRVIQAQLSINCNQNKYFGYTNILNFYIELLYKNSINIRNINTDLIYNSNLEKHDKLSKLV